MKHLHQQIDVQRSLGGLPRQPTGDVVPPVLAHDLHGAAALPPARADAVGQDGPRATTCDGIFAAMVMVVAPRLSGRRSPPRPGCRRTPRRVCASDPVLAAGAARPTRRPWTGAGCRRSRLWSPGRGNGSGGGRGFGRRLTLVSPVHRCGSQRATRWPLCGDRTRRPRSRAGQESPNRVSGRSGQPER